MKSENVFAVGALALVGALGVALGAAGCATSSPTSDQAASTSAADTASTGRPKLVSADITKGGAQLWAENCNRCHNSRSPSERSDVQWGVIAHHMRLQATLTGEEYRKILEFLRASN